MNAMRIITNNVARPIMDAWELTEKERKEFDYLDWEAIERGEDSASFFRYKGQLYDLGEFQRIGSPFATLPADNPISQWDGLVNDSFFSGIVIKIVEEGDSVICGTFIA